MFDKSIVVLLQNINTNLTDIKISVINYNSTNSNQTYKYEQ